MLVTLLLLYFQNQHTPLRQLTLSVKSQFFNFYRLCNAVVCQILLICFSSMSVKMVGKSKLIHHFCNFNRAITALAVTKLIMRNQHIGVMFAFQAIFNQTAQILTFIFLDKLAMRSLFSIANTADADYFQRFSSFLKHKRLPRFEYPNALISINGKNSLLALPF